MDRRVMRTKRNIYLAFFTLLQKKPMDEITVTELAELADMNRKTFYRHYQNVQEVYDEFKEGRYDFTVTVLKECYRRGAENQARLDAGEALERAEDIAPFDYIYFFDGLHQSMLENMDFFEKMSVDKQYMFLKNDYKDIMKESILNTMPNREEASDYENSVYAEFVAGGVISLWTDWLHRQAVPLETFRDEAIKMLKKVWKA